MRRSLVVLGFTSLFGLMLGWEIRGCVNDCQPTHRRDEVKP